MIIISVLYLDYNYHLSFRRIECILSTILLLFVCFFAVTITDIFVSFAYYVRNFLPYIHINKLSNCGHRLRAINQRNKYKNLLFIKTLINNENFGFTSVDTVICDLFFVVVVVIISFLAVFFYLRRRRVQFSAILLVQSKRFSITKYLRFNFEYILFN